MNFSFDEITEDNFNKLLVSTGKEFNNIDPPLDINNITSVDIQELNAALHDHSATFDKLGRVAIKMDKLKRFAEQQYELKKIDAMEEARLDKERFTAEGDRKNHAEKESRFEYKRLVKLKSKCDEIDRMRSTIFRRLKDFEQIGNNIRADMRLLQTNTGGF